MATVKIEIIGDSPEDMLWTLGVIAERIGAKLPDAVEETDLSEVIVEVNPTETALTKLLAEEPKPRKRTTTRLKPKADVAEEAPAEEIITIGEPPVVDGATLKEAALNAIKAVYDDKPIRAKFRPLLAEFDVTAFGDIKDADGARFHARVQEIIDQHHEDAA